MSTSQKQVILRLFREGSVRILLSEGTGRSTREVTSFEGKAGNYSFDLDLNGLETGMYYLYLVVDDQVVHLQEMVIE
jgi:hypothetical protein